MNVWEHGGKLDQMPAASHGASTWGGRDRARCQERSIPAGVEENTQDRSSRLGSATQRLCGKLSIK